MNLKGESIKFYKNILIVIVNCVDKVLEREVFDDFYIFNILNLEFKF